MSSNFNIASIKSTFELKRLDFPILSREINGKPLVYLDNAASTQKPKQVIKALMNYYETSNSNIHRSAHSLAAEATTLYENARNLVRDWIGAASSKEILFTSGTTESINVVARSWGKKFLKAQDEVIIARSEHHSNIVPWQMIAHETGAKVKMIDIDENGKLDIMQLESCLSERTKIVSFAWISNALGVVQPIEEAIALVRQMTNAKVLIDAAQAVGNKNVNVKRLDCDFLAFSGHKMYGPTGIGILYGKEEILNDMLPFKGGGEMIDEVTEYGFTTNQLPYKFEAGTPNIAGAVGLAEAVNYIESIGIEAISSHKSELIHYCHQLLKGINGIKFYGFNADNSGVISFTIDDIHPFDLGSLLNQQGIAIRTGHHCCQPLMKHFGVEGTCRVSFGLYNTKEEIDNFISALHKCISILK